MNETTNYMKITIEYTNGTGSISAVIAEDNPAGYDVMNTVLGEFWMFHRASKPLPQDSSLTWVA
jgi:regulation of enolase protein 1 (concanavalin A-like superfamily)